MKLLGRDGAADSSPPWPEPTVMTHHPASLPPPAEAPAVSSVNIVRTSTLGVPADAAKSLADCVRRLPIGTSGPRTAFITTFVNPHSAIRLRTDQNLSTLLNRFDLVLPDGIGMCIAMRCLHKRPALRVSFDSTSLAPAVFAAACRHGSTIALIGGAPGVAKQAAEHLRVQFPGIRIVATFDGYNERDLALASPEVVTADIAICGMGIGVQEGFLVALQERGWNGCGFTCGAYFDHLNAGFRYYPAWIDGLHLRWAYRLYREPKRLWRRYLVDYPYFILLFLKALFEMHLPSRSRSGDLKGMHAAGLVVEPTTSLKH
jgi:N-acetylglucosaminyldiphosphoundecaprenol N-acetyl-beta-D-mannosaminyltransferase